MKKIDKSNSKVLANIKEFRKAPLHNLAKDVYSEIEARAEVNMVS